MQNRTIAALAVWILLIALTACAMPEADTGTPAPETAAPTLEIPNPMVEVPSAAEIGQALGFAFPLPPDNAEDVRCFVIANQLGHMTFTYNGQPYTLRGAKEFEGDISGLYVEFEPQMLEQTIDDTICPAHLTLRYIAERGVVVSWQDAGIDYTLHASEEPLRPGEATGNCDALDLAYGMTRALYLPVA